VEKKTGTRGKREEAGLVNFGEGGLSLQIRNKERVLRGVSVAWGREAAWKRAGGDKGKEFDGHSRSGWTSPGPPTKKKKMEREGGGELRSTFELMRRHQANEKRKAKKILENHEEALWKSWKTRGHD